MDIENKSSIEVAKILSHTAVRAFKMRADEVITAFDEAEDTCLLLVSSKELKLEVNRRVAEWKMEILCDHNDPFELVNKMHNSILKLGFSNLENEANIETYFALYCIRQNQTKVAKEILLKLIAKLNDAIKFNDLDIYHYWGGLAEKHLSKIQN